MDGENVPSSRQDQPSESAPARYRPDLNQNEVDHAVGAWSAVLGTVPGVGAILGEVVRTIIPNQGQDRIADFVQALDDELRDVRREVLELKMRTPEFGDLFRDTAYQAAATPSAERRRRLAALLKNSITREELEHEKERKLLSLLREVNDAELIILGYFGTGMVGEKAGEYYWHHEDIVSPPFMEGGMSDEEVRDATMKQEYRDHLRRLGLIASKRVGPEGITSLGRLLLRYVDGPESEWMDE